MGCCEHTSREWESDGQENETPKKSPVGPDNHLAERWNADKNKRRGMENQFQENYGDHDGPQ